MTLSSRPLLPLSEKRGLGSSNDTLLPLSEKRGLSSSKDNTSSKVGRAITKTQLAKICQEERNFQGRITPPSDFVLADTSVGSPQFFILS